MFNSAVLEVTMGILVVFLLVSTVCTAIREGIESLLKTRAAYLEMGIRELLHDEEAKGLARAFFNHPIIYCLYPGKYRPGSTKRQTLQRGGDMPSYVSGRTFALALMDIVARGPTTDAASSSPELAPLTFESLRQNVGNLDNPQLQRVLLMAIDSAEGDLEQVRQNLHQWFDDSMDRVSGWYKRSTQWVLFVVAMVVVGSLNINTITIAQHLYKNDMARAELVLMAERASQSAPAQDAALGQLMDLELPLGWDRGYGAPRLKHWHDRDGKFELWNDVFGTVLGLFITVFAAMLGAPFWFDLLGRVTAIRSTFKPKAPSSDPPAQTSAKNALNAGARAQTGQGSPSPSGGAEPPPDDGDACDHPIDSETADEDLPPARGGVMPS